MTTTVSPGPNGDLAAYVDTRLRQFDVAQKEQSNRLVVALDDFKKMLKEHSTAMLSEVEGLREFIRERLPKPEEIASEPKKRARRRAR